MEGIKDIYKELYPVYFVSKIVGLAPYTFTYQLSPPLCLVTSVYILLTLGTTGFLMSLPAFGQSTFSLILDRGQILLLSITTIVTLVKALTNSEQLVQLSTNFIKLDGALKSVGIFIGHNFRFGLVHVVVRILILLPVTILDFHTKRLSLVSFTTEYMRIAPQLVTLICEAQFMALVNAVTSRVNSMAQTVEFLSTKSYHYKPKKLIVMASSHSQLVEMVSSINSMFTVQMFLIMFNIFLLTTTHLYDIIDAITQTTTQEFVTLVKVTLRVCVRSYELWTITTLCVNAKETIKEFTRVLYQVLIEDESGVLAENKKLQLHVSMKKEVSFTAYNFFPIDYTLVHSMISAATTYLVILVQFSSISSSPSEAPTV